VPFENSSNGSVVFTLDLFADLQGRYPDIQVEGEVYVQVRHCLLGRSKDHRGSRQPSSTTTTNPSQNGTNPLHDISHIRKLYSHPQAWGQCKRFLSAHLKGLERQDVSSTSKAAELVAQDTTGTSAAISSKMAAGVNGLDVLAEGIEDSEGNSTRFFVITRRDQAQQVELEEGGNDDRKKGDVDDHHKTLILFTVEHGEPGALADCLAVFKKHGLNLTSISTRPSGEAPWHYIFFVELMGRKYAVRRGGAVNDALQDLDKLAKSCRWLGSWENALKQ